MDYRVNEKGKVFTDRMTKQRVAITAGVGELIVHGEVHLKPDHRLKDELNDAEQFIAITNARVMRQTGKRPVRQTDVLIVNKAHLLWIFEDTTQ